MPILFLPSHYPNYNLLSILGLSPSILCPRSFILGPHPSSVFCINSPHPRWSHSVNANSYISNSDGFTTLPLKLNQHSSSIVEVWGTSILPSKRQRTLGFQLQDDIILEPLLKCQKLVAGFLLVQTEKNHELFGKLFDFELRSCEIKIVCNDSTILEAINEALRISNDKSGPDWKVSNYVGLVAKFPSEKGVMKRKRKEVDEHGMEADLVGMSKKRCKFGGDCSLDDKDPCCSRLDPIMGAMDLRIPFEPGFELPFQAFDFKLCSFLICDCFVVKFYDSLNFGDCSKNNPNIIMKILSWNCQGLGQSSTVHLIASLVMYHKPDILFLCETLCSKSTVDTHLSRLKFPVSFDFNAIGTNEGLWLGVSSNVNINLIFSSKNLILIESFTENNQSWFLGGIYGNPKLNLREETWKSISNTLEPFINKPILFCGDYNQVLTNFDKFSTPFSLIPGSNHLLNLINKFGLEDLGYLGAKFTWSGIRNKIKIYEKLNHAMSNFEWSSEFSFSTCLCLPIQR
ncbi:hypothetical protein LIER_15635 [Lithospermum erythrorhizon]|uniref:Endonuclease/exonuclease/phosphatase domain-containing protein n=1 Tax=Lithospermum erythrorhizon TaxID=34254 RepID=A0AAV3Q7Q5_LITER